MVMVFASVVEKIHHEQIGKKREDGRKTKRNNRERIERKKEK